MEEGFSFGSCRIMERLGWHSDWVDLPDYYVIERYDPSADTCWRRVDGRTFREECEANTAKQELDDTQFNDRFRVAIVVAVTRSV